MKLPILFFTLCVVVVSCQETIKSGRSDEEEFEAHKFTPARARLIRHLSSGIFKDDSTTGELQLAQSSDENSNKNIETPEQSRPAQDRLLY